MKTMKRISVLFWVFLLIGCLVLPAAAQSGTHIFDEANVLTDDQFYDMEIRAAQISEQYGIGVYIATVNSYKSLGYQNIEEFTIKFFDNNQLGLGVQKNGVFICISMVEREYDFDIHGSLAENAMTEAGRDRVEDRMVGRMSNDDFAGAMSIFLNSCDQFFEAAKQGNPVGYGEPSSADYTEETGLGIFLFVPGLIAALVTGFVMSGSMKSSSVKSDADFYADGRLNLRSRSDMFLTRTVTRTPRQTSSGNSGSRPSASSHHYSSGGHSGRSGKF